MESREAMKRLNELLTQVETTYLTIATENGLSYNALMILLMVGEDEHVTQKDVCEALHLPKSSVHGILKEQIDRGFLRLTEGGNKKEKYILPTTDGEEFIRKVSNETAEIENNTIEAISEPDMRRFIRTAEMLTDRMIRETKRLYGER